MEKRTYSLGSDRTEQERLHIQRMLYGDTVDVRFNPGEKVCEIGCGPLSNAWIPLALGEGKYVGVDIQPAHIEEARQRTAALGLSNAEFLISDGAATGLAGDSFDAGFCRCLLIHLSDPIPVLRELLRLVRPEGRVVLIEPHDPTYYVTPDKPNLLRVHRARDRFAYGGGRGCPDAALNLYTFLTQLGLREVKVRPHVIYATGAEPERCLALMQNWVGLTQPVIALLLEQGLVTEQEWKRACGEAESVAAETFLYQSMWIAEGVKVCSENGGSRPKRRK
jgi:SAM-dependent methyltransferase